MGAVIKGIEYYLPEKVLTNTDLQKEFPEYDFLKFENKVGIIKRHIAGDNQTALDLSIEACKKLFERFDKSKIDFVLYCTQSPEYILPTTACILQDRLLLKKSVGALDFNLGCSGYTYGVSIAKSLVVSGMAKNVLLVTAETYSKYIHKSDRTNRSIFGDGASATLISENNTNGIGEFVFGTDGSGFDKLIIKNSGSNSTNEIDENIIDNHLFMDGPEVFNFTINTIPNTINEVLLKNNLEKSEVDQFILHQANSFMLNHLRKLSSIDKVNFYNNLLEEGNTVSNTIPIALKKYSLSLEFNNSQTILLLGFGVGLSWCGGLITIENKL